MLSELAFAEDVNTVSQKAGRETMVYLESCDVLSFNEQLNAHAQLLKGHVRFRHDDALMFCDSAYFYESDNSVDAFGHVKFVQGDTLFAFGDVLYYNGNTKLARLRRHVRLVHKETTLTTDSLNYDRKHDLAYYFTGGMIVDSVNTLTSIWGEYKTSTCQASFRNKVDLTHPKSHLTSDTLLYNTRTHIAYLVGPTRIDYDTTTTILSTLGWYNTNTEQSTLYNRSKVIHCDGKTLTGDTLYYDRASSYGKIMSNIEMRDTIRKLTLTGHRSEMYEDGKHGYVTDSAMVIDWSSEDSTFMHADSIFTEEVKEAIMVLPQKDSISPIGDTQSPDTIWKDTSFQRLRAFWGVRIWRIDVQSVCDSLVYTFKDSVMTMYRNPICWNNNQQISADSIKIFMHNNTIDYIWCVRSAIAIKEEGYGMYDQITGKEIKAYVVDQEVKTIDVNGSAETIYYPRDDDEEIVGVNRIKSSHVKIFLNNKKVQRVLFKTSPIGTMFPLSQMPEDQKKLKLFFWAIQERPAAKEDIFLKVSYTHRPQNASITPQTKKIKKNKKGHSTLQ